MKLSYRDRVILVVVLILAIIAIVFFALIKPKAKQIVKNNTKCEDLQKEWEDKEREHQQINGLRSTIQKGRDAGVDAAKYFTELRAAYQIDQFLQPLLDENNIKLVENFTVSDPKTSTLDFYYYVPDTPVYDIYKNADLDGSMAAALLEKQKEAAAASAMGAQGLACSSAHIICRVTKEELTNFLADVKALDTSVIITNVTIDDYTFCPRDSQVGKLAAALKDADEIIDHSRVTIDVDFYSVQQATDPYLGPEYTPVD